MDKIASPSELRQELSRLASYCHVPSPSRDKLASALRSLADNLSPRTATETRQSGHTIDVEAQLKKYSGLADGLYRDLYSLSKKLWYMRDDPAKKQLYYNLSAAKEAAAKTMEGLYSALRDAQGSL